VGTTFPIRAAPVKLYHDIRLKKEEEGMMRQVKL
jgi:hypothetical protein